MLKQRNCDNQPCEILPPPPPIGLFLTKRTFDSGKTPNRSRIQHIRFVFRRVEVTLKFSIFFLRGSHQPINAEKHVRRPSFSLLWSRVFRLVFWRHSRKDRDLTLTCFKFHCPIPALTRPQVTQLMQMIAWITKYIRPLAFFIWIENFHLAFPGRQATHFWIFSLQPTNDIIIQLYPFQNGSYGKITWGQDIIFIKPLTYFFLQEDTCIVTLTLG